MTAEPESIAIVTGGSRGIGLQIARSLGLGGYRVLLVARDRDRLLAAEQELARERVRCASLAVDLLAEESAEAVLEAAHRTFGPPDVLINNAGTAPTARIEATTDAMLDETLGLHVRAPLRLIRAVLPGMKERGSGCLVQVASTAGLRGFPFTTAYTAAKHGMVGLTRAISAELAKSPIDVYAVCPGFVDTDITRKSADAIAARGRTTAADALLAMAGQNRIGRMHSAAEVAAAVLALARERPSGCVFELDRDPPGFVD